MPLSRGKEIEEVLGRGVRRPTDNLPSSDKAKDIDDLFSRFGKILNVDLQSRSEISESSPPIPFIEFEDPRYYADLIH